MTKRESTQLTYGCFFFIALLVAGFFAIGQSVRNVSSLLAALSAGSASAKAAAVHPAHSSASTDAFNICSTRDFAALLFKAYVDPSGRFPIRVYQATKVYDARPTSVSLRAAQKEVLGRRPPLPRDLRDAAIVSAAIDLGQQALANGTLQLDHGRDVIGPYYVFLSGTDFHWGTDLLADFLTAFGLHGLYANTLYRTLQDDQTFPRSPKRHLILVGHSLGGMVAREMLLRPDVVHKFSGIDVVTFGAPPIRKGDIIDASSLRFFQHSPDGPAVLASHPSRIFPQVRLHDFALDDDGIAMFGPNLPTVRTVIDLPHWSPFLESVQHHLSYDSFFYGIQHLDGLANSAQDDLYECADVRLSKRISLPMAMW